MTKAPEDLLIDVHTKLDHITSPHQVVVGEYAYYHYLCDGLDDRGWGCGYRTLQTLCSWVYFKNLNHKSQKQSLVPSIHQIQQALVSMKDKPPSFLNSREWIGSFEVCLCLDYFFDVPCKIHHIRNGDELFDGLKVLWDHFDTFGSPVMMGGDCDASSKCVLGICGNSKRDCHLLILDPHCSIIPSLETVVRDKWISWKNIETFDNMSFYNLCLPQFKPLNKK